MSVGHKKWWLMHHWIVDLSAVMWHWRAEIEYCPGGPKVILQQQTFVSLVSMFIKRLLQSRFHFLKSWRQTCAMSWLISQTYFWSSSFRRESWCVRNYALCSEVEINLVNLHSHLSVRALLWLSLAACRSLSRRFFSDSSFSASLGSRRWRGLMYCSSFSSSSFSLMRMRRSRSGSKSPGHASLSSFAICTSMVAILRGEKKRRRTEITFVNMPMTMTLKLPTIKQPWGIMGNVLSVMEADWSHVYLLLASSYFRLRRTFSASLLVLVMNWIQTEH